MKQKSFFLPFILAFTYILIGTYDYYNNLSVSTLVDGLYSDLDLTLILPSNIFGILIRNLCSFFYDSDLFFVLGQLLGLVIYTSLIWIAITFLKLIYRKITK